MLEIKIGSYGISKNRLYIIKIIGVRNGKIYARLKKNGTDFIINPENYDFYDNLSDIVKIGDFVNGRMIRQINTLSFETYGQGNTIILKNEVQNILTKEMYEADCFEEF